MINGIIVSAAEEIYFKTKKCENLKNIKSIRRNEFYHSLPDKGVSSTKFRFYNKIIRLKKWTFKAQRKIMSEKRKAVVRYIGFLSIRLDKICHLTLLPYILRCTLPCHFYLTN